MSPVAPSSAVTSKTRSGADRRLPGLDGLRGLAVAWVLAFHLWPDVVRGGWLGVGLFFTLSGYLIAGLLDTEVTTTGRLRLGRFMARRVRRLLPAALVTIAATLALTAILDDQPLRTIGVDALTAALNVFNWHASLDEVGYAGIFEAAPEPLAHFWSLAIEEQFYLVFPAAVALTRRPGRVVCAMAAVGLVGVWLWWGSTDAYVATPVRALEIAAGAGLAVAQARFGAVRRLFQPPADLPRPSRLAWAVLLAVAAALTAVSVARLGPDEALVFRGGPQLMALCWVVLVIAAVRDGWPARLMSWAPLRWLGLRSYAIYLFHWPVIELTDWHPAVVIAVTLGAAEASFHLLEMPARRGTGRWAIPVLAAAAVAVVTVAGVAAAASEPARAVAERAEGADELPAWLTEQDPLSPAAPADDGATGSLPELTAPDPAPTAAPAAPSTLVEQPHESPETLDGTASSDTSTPESSASAPATSEPSTPPAVTQPPSAESSTDAPGETRGSETRQATEPTIMDVERGFVEATDDTPVPVTTHPVTGNSPARDRVHSPDRHRHRRLDGGTHRRRSATVGRRQPGHGRGGPLPHRLLAGRVPGQHLALPQGPGGRRAHAQRVPARGLLPGRPHPARFGGGAGRGPRRGAVRPPAGRRHLGLDTGPGSRIRRGRLVPPARGQRSCPGRPGSVHHRAATADVRRWPVREPAPDQPRAGRGLQRSHH